MPPKKAGGGKGPSNKTASNQKQKVIDDKTFGLKNKNKSAKVSKYIKQVEANVMAAGNRKAKELKAKKEEELSLLFNPVLIQQKVPFGVDPKTIVCINFKNNACKKGDKCKFSHDLAVDRKVAKIDLYTDKREGSTSQQKEGDTMDGWDMDKLSQVVSEKQKKQTNATDIVCRNFIDAIETGKYGWFWICPNGGDKCKYRHALPPGFVLPSVRKEKEREEREKDQISLEQFLETERHNLGSDLTPVTLETFTKWKKARLEEKAKLVAEDKKQKETDVRAGRASNLTGRDYFDLQHLNVDALTNNSAMDSLEDDNNAFDLNDFRDSLGQFSNNTNENENENGNENTNEKINDNGIDYSVFAQEDISDISDDD
ncbi:Translation machinery-associated protein 46 [Zancudomyces culisetae]|uniref:Translation machinery-associated protein 46 n=1 Tax=Zancudomyces culisetae TaxID=1213189 RepID=A0A1R1PEY9_ZANCU|nr:Translation machinery-associated protein 46 [Zancudomyces culisetae]|eukprot:OMH79565.1 Translation machinery-associated protein 46 [Zancudomyces culisetae]